MEDGQLAEYETLRAEIIEERKGTNTLFIYGLIATGGLLAYAAQAGTGASYLIPLAVLLPTLLLMYYNDVRTLEKASYILVFHEQETPDLQWETAVYRQRCNNPSRRSVYGKWWGPTVIGRQVPYFALAIACLLLSYMSWGQSNMVLWSLIAAGTVACAAGIYVLQITLSKRQRRLVKQWEDAKARSQTTS